MFPSAVFQPDWLHQQRKQLGNCDPNILEKCVYALTLLGSLVESGLPFIFKGGTSLLLHLPEVRRLSRDIDIVCGRPASEVEAVVQAIGSKPPFLRWEEDNRGVRGLPQRRHFKFFYRSALPGNVEQELLLDVVEEGREVHTVVERPIQTSFLIPEIERRVRVPSVESLLGDKLTAFAPHTTGVPFHAAKSGEEQLQQVAKQLFDVGVLFDVAEDFDAVARSYNAISAQEIEYRATGHTREAALEDTFQACVALTANKPAILKSYDYAPLLHEGFEKLKGHLTWPKFTGLEPRRTLAAKAAVLAAHLKAGVPFDFAANRYTGSADQIAALKAASLNGKPLSWIDGVRGVNPEAYHYWHLALQLST